MKCVAVFVAATSLLYSSLVEYRVFTTMTTTNETVMMDDVMKVLKSNLSACNLDPLCLNDFNDTLEVGFYSYSLRISNIKIYGFDSMYRTADANFTVESSAKMALCTVALAFPQLEYFLDYVVEKSSDTSSGTANGTVTDLYVKVSMMANIKNTSAVEVTISSLTFYCPGDITAYLNTDEESEEFDNKMSSLIMSMFKENVLSFMKDNCLTIMNGILSNMTFDLAV